MASKEIVVRNSMGDELEEYIHRNGDILEFRHASLELFSRAVTAVAVFMATWSTLMVAYALTFGLFSHHPYWIMRWCITILLLTGVVTVTKMVANKRKRAEAAWKELTDVTHPQHRVDAIPQDTAVVLRLVRETPYTANSNSVSRLRVIEDVLEEQQFPVEQWMEALEVSAQMEERADDLNHQAQLHAQRVSEAQEVAHTIQQSLMRGDKK